MSKFQDPFTAIALVILVILLPLPKAGMIDWFQQVFVLSTLVLFTFFLISAITGNAEVDAGWVMVWGVFTLVCCAHYFGYAGMFADEQFTASRNLNPDLIAGPSAPLDRGELIHSWLLFSSYWAIVSIVRNLSRVSVQWLIVGIMVSALFQSVYGLFALATGAETYLGIWEKIFGLTRVTGTFVHQNHFSAFLIICLLLSLALLLSRNQADAARVGWLKLSLLGCFVMIVTAAIVGSQSRAAFVVSFLAILLFFLILAKTRKDTRSRRDIAIVYVLFGLTIFAAIWYGIDAVLNRFLLLSGGDSRVDMWRDLFDLPIGLWLQGVGAGQFSFVYKTVQQTLPLKQILYAHNDYLHALLEFGLVGSFAIIFIIFTWLVRHWPSRPSTLQIGALSAIVAVLILSIVDFHLHIPAVALVFWIAVGIWTNHNLNASTTEFDKSNAKKNRSRLRNSGSSPVL